VKTQIPLFRKSPESRPFWKAAQEGHLVLPYCQNCNQPHLPVGPVCPFCFSDLIIFKESLGKGKVSSYTVVHKQWFPDFYRSLPYNVVQVELAEGPRLTGVFEDRDMSKLKVAANVKVSFKNLTPEITLIVFCPE